jgi:hypothetical protein
VEQIPEEFTAQARDRLLTRNESRGFERHSISKFDELLLCVAFYPLRKASPRLAMEICRGTFVWNGLDGLSFEPATRQGSTLLTAAAAGDTWCRFVGKGIAMSPHAISAARNASAALP